MTPAETYAQKRLEAIELIRAHAPARLQEPLIELLRPAIALSATRAEDSQIPVGASKFGGAPDVPLHFLWPEWNEKPLGFLAQINLEEVAAFDVEELLPKNGLLSFFRRFADDSPRDNGEVIRVFHLESELQRAVLPENISEPDCQIIPAEAVNFSPEWTTREYNWDEIEGVWDYDTYIDSFLPTFGRTKGVHRLLGQPILVHDSVFLEAEMERLAIPYAGNKEVLESGALDWRLLLQLDFKEPDCYFGVAYFLIHKEDLTARRFDQTQFIYHGD